MVLVSANMSRFSFSHYRKILYKKVHAKYFTF